MLFSVVFLSFVFSSWADLMLNLEYKIHLHTNCKLKLMFGVLQYVSIKSKQAYSNLN